MESRLVGILILAFLRALAWSYFLLPRPFRGFWQRSLSLLLRTTGFRSEIIRQNLDLAYPGDVNREKRLELFRGAYDHLAALSLEILLLLGPMKKFVLQSSRIEGVEHWTEAKKRGQGVLFLASHVGNWEVMAATGALLARIDIMLVTKHLKPEWLHGAIETGRKQCGVSATYEPKTLRDVLTHLKANGTIGFVLDQYAGPPVGVRVPFFGIPVGTSTALATLAKRTGAAVLPVVNFRNPDGSFSVRIGAPVTWIATQDSTEELAVNTAQYARIMEAQVRAYPHEWLWTHRRFKGVMEALRPDEWKEGRPRR